MKTITTTAVIALLFALLSLAGCGTMGTFDPMGQHPYAYDATRGGTTDGVSGGAFGASPASKDSESDSGENDE